MSAGEQVLVRARGVQKTFASGRLQTPVLHDVSLDLHPGQFTLLMGPSGSGKTTLLSILSGLLRPSAGQVQLCGVDIGSAPDAVSARVRRRHVGFVFQSYHLFPALDALDNVAEVLVLKGMAREQARTSATRILARMGLGARLQHLPSELSGGERQRVAIARALAGDPALIVGDEPTGALDKNTGLAVMDALRQEITPQRGVLIVTHDPRLKQFADRVLEIEDGRIVADYAHTPGAHEVYH
jgi:putative ABC transport system ATP-binding protein